MPATTPRPAFRRLVHLSLALATVYLAHVATAAEPERVTGANYPLAAKFSKEFVAQHARLPVGPLVSPKWIGKTDGFWYSVPTSSGMKYWKVDPDKNTKEPLFDAAALAGKLSEQAKKPFDATNLPIANVRVSDDGANMTFTGDEYRYEFEFATLKLTKLGKAPVGPPFPGAGAAGGQLTEEQRRRLEEMRDQVSTLHANLAALPFRLIVTSNHDPLMETALRRADKNPAVAPGRRSSRSRSARRSG